MTTAALTTALPFTAYPDEPRGVDVAAVGQGIKTNLEQIQQYASTVQQYQTQLGRLQQQLADAARPGLQLYDKAQQTVESVQQVQRIFESGSLYLRQLTDFQFYRARASSAQAQALASDAGESQGQSPGHAQKHH